MADLNDQQAAQTIKITGSSSLGAESNYVNADAAGNLFVIDAADGPVTPGTVASKSQLGGMQYNTTPPEPTNNQQVALQSTSDGRLKVEGNSIVGSKMRIVDMNASNGGVARGTGIASTTVYTTIFNYSGSGRLFSFLVSLEGNLFGADAFNIKLEIDDVIVAEILTTDVGTNTLYNLGAVGDEATMGMSIDSNVFRFAMPGGVSFGYASNLKVSVKKATSASSKQFRAGMVYMTKET